MSNPEQVVYPEPGEIEALMQTAPGLFEKFASRVNRNRLGVTEVAVTTGLVAGGAVVHEAVADAEAVSAEELPPVFVDCEGFSFSSTLKQGQYFDTSTDKLIAQFSPDPVLNQLYLDYRSDLVAAPSPSVPGAMFGVEGDQIVHYDFGDDGSYDFKVYDWVSSSELGALLLDILIERPPECDAEPYPFTDVPLTHFAREDIRLLEELNITKGVGNGEYGPNNLVTREQMAAFMMRLYRILGGTEPNDIPFPFTDVSDTSFAREDIEDLKVLEVTTGVGNAKYGPSNLVTREQMAAFMMRLRRALGYEDPDTSDVERFDDVDPGSFAFDDILVMRKLEITTGINATQYGPGDPVTRGQMAAFIARLYRLVTND